MRTAIRSPLAGTRAVERRLLHKHRRRDFLRRNTEFHARLSRRYRHLLRAQGWLPSQSASGFNRVSARTPMAVITAGAYFAKCKAPQPEADGKLMWLLRLSARGTEWMFSLLEQCERMDALSSRSIPDLLAALLDEGHEVHVYTDGCLEIEVMRAFESRSQSA